MSSTFTTSSPPIYFYLFDYRMEAPNCLEINRFCDYAFHAADVPFVFANGESIGCVFYQVLFNGNKCFLIFTMVQVFGPVATWKKQIWEFRKGVEIL